MFQNHTTTAIVVALLSLGAASGMAAQTTYDIDKDHSSVGFTVKHMLSNVKGNFNDFTGTILMDDKDPSKDKVDVTIKTASIDTRNDKRNEHLKSADFFDALKMPEMIFKSTKITRKGKDKYAVDGLLKLHGVEKPVRLEATFLGKIKDPWGGTRASFSAKGKINRKDFGLMWNKVLETGGVLVGENVDMDFEVEATEAKNDTNAKAPGKTEKIEEKAPDKKN